MPVPGRGLILAWSVNEYAGDRAIGGIGHQFIAAIAIDVGEADVVCAAVAMGIDDAHRPGTVKRVPWPKANNHPAVVVFGVLQSADRFQNAVSGNVFQHEANVNVALGDNALLEGVWPVPEQAALATDQQFNVSVSVNVARRQRPQHFHRRIAVQHQQLPGAFDRHGFTPCPAVRRAIPLTGQPRTSFRPMRSCGGMLPAWMMLLRAPWSLQSARPTLKCAGTRTRDLVKPLRPNPKTVMLLSIGQ